MTTTARSSGLGPDRSAYDCEFVTMAQALGVRLVASDRPVLASVPGVAIALREYGAGAPATSRPRAEILWADESWRAPLVFA